MGASKNFCKFFRQSKIFGRHRGEWALRDVTINREGPNEGGSLRKLNLEGFGLVPSEGIAVLSYRNITLHRKNIYFWEIPEENDLLEFSLLPLTRPIDSPPKTPVAQKIRNKRWLLANSAKNRYHFSIKWCDYSLVSVNKHRFFFSISFVRMSYKIIWLKTDLYRKTHWKMKAERLKLVFSKRCASKICGGSVTIRLNLDSVTLKTSSASFCETACEG